MKKRNQIEESLKWDLGLFKTKQEIEKVFEYIETITKDFSTYNGKLNNKDYFFNYLNKYKKETIEISKLGYYLGNTLNVDSSNTEILKLISRYEIAMQKQSQALAFITPQMYELSDKFLKECLNDPRAKDNENFIKDIIKFKPHKLDEKTNQVIADLGNSFSNSSSVFDIFTDSEMPFDDAVNSKGKHVKITNATYKNYVASKDRVLRESAYNSMMNGYGKFNKTFAELYIKDLKHDNDFVKLEKYTDLLESCLMQEDIPKQVYLNNLKYVGENIPVLQKFVKQYAKFTKLNKFSYYDLFLDEQVNGKVSIENAKQTILSALAPLGKEYIAKVKHKFNDKSIDYMPNQNKSSGAYCSNCYGAKTMILTNWTNDFDSMSTLAHEMGHCINAEYFNEAQPMQKAGITIFAAEIASTVNEILLNQYMQKHSNKKQKIYYLHEFLDGVRATIFRQTLFSEFELYAHTAIEKEEPITYAELNKKYYDLNKKYYGNSCILPKNLQYEWSRIPHFYNPYYVYSYSTGLITAISIANNILKDHSFAEKYIKFLKNGTEKPAVEMLKEIGLDLTSPTPYKNAFNFIKSQLTEYISLTNS